MRRPPVRRSRWVAALWVAAAPCFASGACNAISGVEDYSFDRQPAGSTAAAGGAGGVGAAGGGGGAGGSPDAGLPDADASACPMPLPCVLVEDGAAEEAPCNDGAFSAACAPPTWDLCRCGGAPQAPAIFFDPPSGSPGGLSVVTLIAPTAGAPYALSIGNICPGQAQESCPAMGDCGDVSVYRWTETLAPMDSGTRKVSIWSQDGDPPCTPTGGGTRLIEVDYVTP